MLTFVLFTSGYSLRMPSKSAHSEDADDICEKGLLMFSEASSKRDRYMQREREMRGGGVCGWGWGPYSHLCVRARVRMLPCCELRWLIKVISTDAKNSVIH